MEPIRVELGHCGQYDEVSHFFPTRTALINRGLCKVLSLRGREATRGTYFDLL